MTPDQEIERILREYKDQRSRLESYPSIRKAISENDVVKLGELAAMLVKGNYMPLKVLNVEDYSTRDIVVIDKLTPKWMDVVYVSFKSGNHVNLTSFVYPNDVKVCEGWAKQIGAEHGMNPAKTVFFFRHRNYEAGYTPKILTPR